MRSAVFVFGLAARALVGCHLISGSTEYEVSDDAVTGTTSTAQGGGNTAGGQGGTAGPGGFGGSGAAGSGGSGGCVEHWDCPPAQVCLAAACNVAWARQYRFTIVGANITPTNPNVGGDWDPGAGAPDAYVEAFNDTTLLGTTATVDNSFMPTWNESHDIVLNQGGPDIRFDMYDGDIDPDDFITDAIGSPEEWLDVLRDPVQDGALITDNVGILFTVTIAPL